MGIVGINLDLLNAVGHPNAALLNGFEYARLPYNVSQGRGLDDAGVADAQYGPYIQDLLNAGITPILIMTHQLWGEARPPGQEFNWKSMSDADWDRFTTGYVEMLRSVAQRVAPRAAGKPVIYQIMNEHDSLDPNVSASVVVPAVKYGQLFNKAYSAVKDVHPNAQIITGGYVSGPGHGMSEFRAAGIVRTDGVAFHPYGASAGGFFAHAVIPPVAWQLRQWLMLGRPLYITEFSILDRPNESADAVGQYAKAFLETVSGLVVGAIWFGWGDGMHNAYGVTQADGTLKQPLHSALIGTAHQAPVHHVLPDPYLPGTYYLQSDSRINLRVGPSLNDTILRKLDPGTEVRVEIGQAQSSGQYLWQPVTAVGIGGWMATRGGTWWLDDASDG